MEILWLKNIVIEMTNSLEGLNSRFRTAKQSVNLKTNLYKLSNLKNRQKTDKGKMNRDMWGNIKNTSIYIRWIPVGEVKKPGEEHS